MRSKTSRVWLRSEPSHISSVLSTSKKTFSFRTRALPRRACAPRLGALPASSPVACRSRAARRAVVRRARGEGGGARLAPASGRRRPTLRRPPYGVERRPRGAARPPPRPGRAARPRGAAGDALASPRRASSFVMRSRSSSLRCRSFSSSPCSERTSSPLSARSARSRAATRQVRRSRPSSARPAAARSAGTARASPSSISDAAAASCTRSQRSSSSSTSRSRARVRPPSPANRASWPSAAAAARRALWWRPHSV